MKNPKLIKSNLPMSELLTHYGVEKTSKDQYWCPIHEKGGKSSGHRTPSLVLHPKSETVTCMSQKCFAGDDVFRLIAKIENLDTKKDFPKILKIATSITCVNDEVPVKTQELSALRIFPMSAEKVEYLQNRGFTTDTIRSMNLGRLYDKIVFPYMKNSVLVGYKAKTVLPKNERDAYKIKNQKWLPYFIKGAKPDLWHIENDIQNRKIIYLVAGEYDLGILFQEIKKQGLSDEAGVITVTTGEATSIKNETIEYLKSLNNTEFRIVYDDDATGIKEAPQRALELLKTGKRVFVFNWKREMNPDEKEGFDINDYFIANKNIDIFLDPANFKENVPPPNKTTSTSDEEDDKRAIDEIILANLLSNPEVTLFHDEQNKGYIKMVVSDHKEIWPCKSKSMKNFLSMTAWKTNGKPLRSESVKNIISTLEGYANFNGPEIELQNRAAWYKDELWYDLTDKEWRVIKINSTAWEIVDKPPIIFKRYAHHKAQVTPLKSGNLKLLLNYINITNDEHRLLFLVFIVSCFIPDFPHAMLVVFGSQGSSKSTLSKLARLIVDPSMIDVVALPENQRELVQVLAHHMFLFFDNVSYVSEETSDTLCKVITGSGFSKRELYENDEDIIYTLKRCIGMNGINLVATRPDLLERSLLLELDRIEEKNRKSEKDLYKNLENDLPLILGGVFDVLVKTLRTQPTIKIESLPRMADWTLWGCAIAEALGYTKEQFLRAYQNNIKHQTEMLLNENIVATTIIAFMVDKDDWSSTPTELFIALNNDPDFGDLKSEKYWPKAANALSRKLNELSTPLKQMGYLVTISTAGTERTIRIQKLKKDSPDTDDIDDLF